MTVYESERARLGALVRRYRKRRGLTAQQLASLIDASQPKVSRIETGRIAPSIQEVERIAERLELSPDDVAALIEQAERVHDEAHSLRAFKRHGPAQRQADIAALELGAQTITEFQPVAVPGLLQTPEYARRIFSTWVPGQIHFDDETISAAVAARVARQVILHDPMKRFEFLILEEALVSPIVPISVARLQIDRLISLLILDNVEIGIVPADTRLDILPYSGFCVFDKRGVAVELFHGPIAITDPDDVAIYTEAFAELRSIAALGSESEAALRTAARRLC